MKQPKIKTETITLRLLLPEDAPLALQYYLDNSVHLTQWEPSRPNHFFSQAYWQELLAARLFQFNQGESVHFAIIDNHSLLMIGCCNFTQINPALPHGCFLGYSIAQSHQGQGLMAQALSEALDYMFNQRHLHTVTASYMPKNSRSARLLNQFDFNAIGLESDYLQINGRLEDHIVTTKVNPNQFRIK